MALPPAGRRWVLTRPVRRASGRGRAPWTMGPPVTAPGAAPEAAMAAKRSGRWRKPRSGASAACSPGWPTPRPVGGTTIVLVFLLLTSLGNLAMAADRGRRHPGGSGLLAQDCGGGRRSCRHRLHPCGEFARPPGKRDDRPRRRQCGSGGLGSGRRDPRRGRGGVPPERAVSRPGPSSAGPSSAGPSSARPQSGGGFTSRCRDSARFHCSRSSASSAWTARSISTPGGGDAFDQLSGLVNRMK